MVEMKYPHTMTAMLRQYQWSFLWKYSRYFRFLTYTFVGVGLPIAWYTQKAAVISGAVLQKATTDKLARHEKNAVLEEHH